MGHKYASERKLPRLDEQRHAAAEIPPHRARKDKRRWCRGKAGIEHVAGEPQLGSFAASLQAAYPDREPCRWWQTYSWQGLGADNHAVPRGDWRWSCSHIRACVNCGKHLERLEGPECPDYMPRPSVPRGTVKP